MSNINVQNYQNLKVWQETMNLAVSCYQITQEFPPEEKDNLTSEICLVLSSIPPKIADYYQQIESSEVLSIIQGLLNKLETYLFLAVKVNLTSPEKINMLLLKITEVRSLSRSFITT